MENEPASPLPYAHPTTPGETTGYPPKRIPWIVSLVAAVLAGTYLGLVTIAVLTSDDPGRQARGVLHESSYPALLFCLLVLTYRASRSAPYTGAPRQSWLAVASLILAVLNPALLYRVTRERGSHPELTAVAVVGLALVGGIVSVVRIRRSRGALIGMGRAIAATVVSVLFFVFWIVALVVFAVGMSAF